MKTLRIILFLFVLAVLAGVVYVYSGAYPIGADQPHIRPVRWLLHKVSDRAVEAHARGVTVPPEVSSPDSAMLLKGAGQYAFMCSSCHLAPGFTRGDLHSGLYPRPPRFTHGTDLSPAEVFWETKHGIKDTGMPAWGRTHSDQELWGIVAFVERLGKMSPQEYRSIVERAPADSDMTRLPMPRADTTGAPGSH